jgi:hypothetical protein
MKTEIKQNVIEVELIDGSIAKIKDTKDYKALKSDGYNFFFNKKDGYFARWGKSTDYSKKVKKTDFKVQFFLLWSNIWKEKFNMKEFFADLDTDADYFKMIPDIVDFEVSTKSDFGCNFCYKSNKNTGTYISTEDFSKVIEKLPKSICQCALGIGNVDQPNLFELMDVLIDNGIKPNITINGDKLTPEILDKLSYRCGAIAISHYSDKLTFDTVYELATVRGMKQINIHSFLSENTYQKCLDLVEKIGTDSRLKDLNAVVFLSMKKKGNALKNNYSTLSKEKFDYLSNLMLDRHLRFGWDSCSCQNFIRSIDDREDKDAIIECCDPCEAGIASSYISLENGGTYYPCSFCEGVEYAPGDWRNGIKILECEDFLKDVWFQKKTREFTKNNIKCRSNCISCPVFEI